MKKLVVLLLVLATASFAVAVPSFKISVGGVVDPPDTEVFVMYPSGTLILDVHASGMTDNPYTYAGIALVQSVEGGMGSLDTSQRTGWEESSIARSPDEADWLAILPDVGYYNVLAVYDWFAGKIPVAGEDPAVIPDGIVIDNILFHCDGPEDVVIWLMDTDFNVWDKQVIHQVPEPITIALLGLGGLFLRRRIA